MNKLDAAREIRSTLLAIQDRLISSDPDVVKTAMEEYLKLVDRFYSENALMIAPQQYEAAKTDVEYFVRLVDLAVEYYATEGCTDGKQW